MKNIYCNKKCNNSVTVALVVANRVKTLFFFRAFICLLYLLNCVRYYWWQFWSLFHRVHREWGLKDDWKVGISFGRLLNDSDKRHLDKSLSLIVPSWSRWHHCDHLNFLIVKEWGCISNILQSCNGDGDGRPFRSCSQNEKKLPSKSNNTVARNQPFFPFVRSSRVLMKSLKSWKKTIWIEKSELEFRTILFRAPISALLPKSPELTKY